MPSHIAIDNGRPLCTIVIFVIVATITTIAITAIIIIIIKGSSRQRRAARPSRRINASMLAFAVLAGRSR